MYSLAFPQVRLINLEKPIVRLGILIAFTAILSGQNLSLSAQDTGEILKGYIQENTVTKERSDDALFYLKKQWDNELHKKYGKNKIKYLDDGIVYVGTVKYINSKPVKVNIAEINRNINKNIEIIPQLASEKVHARTKVNNIAVKSGAILAVNGTYFKPDTGTPLGTLVINNEIIAGPIYERAALGIFENKFETARVAFRGKIITKKGDINVDNINQPGMSADHVLIYTPKWGVRSPATKKTSKHIAVKDNVAVSVSNYPAIIPQNGFVVSGPEELLGSVKIGDEIVAQYSLNPGWNQAKHIISGGPYLVKNGNVFVDVTAEKLNAVSGKNPRTAIGYTKDNVMIIVTVDGRKEGSSGMTLNELANFMKSLGCIEALNLDGGSSTAMYVAGNVYSGTGISGAVAVSNAVIVRRNLNFNK